MRFSKFFTTALCAALMSGSMFMAAPAEAAEAEANAAAAPAATEQASQADGEIPVMIASTAYRYTSPVYGYSITCPVKPQVIPVSLIYADAHGDILIFDSVDFNIKQAWMVVPNAFKDGDIPDLKTLNDEQKEALFKEWQEKRGCEFARVAEMSDGTLGLYTVTAKDMEVDTDGDGKPDTMVHSDNQMIKTYFTGAYGGHFMVGLINNPDLTREAIATYEAGLNSFQQWPDNINTHNKDTDAKKTK